MGAFTTDPPKDVYEWNLINQEDPKSELIPYGNWVQPEYRSLTFIGYVWGYIPTGWVSGDLVYGKTVTTYGGADPFIKTWVYENREELENEGNTIPPDPLETITDNGGTDFDLPAVPTYENGSTIADSITNMMARVDALVRWDAVNYVYGTDQTAWHDTSPDASTGLCLYSTHTQLAFRISIPEHLYAEQKNTYFKAVFDWVFTPETGPPVVTPDITMEWMAVGTPGYPADPDDDFYLTDWIDIPYPTEPGQTTFDNLKLYYYRDSPFGILPELY